MIGRSILWAGVAGLGFVTSGIRPIPTTVQAPANVKSTIQHIVSHSAACYQRMDFKGFMAMYDPAYHVTGVTGRKLNYRQTYAGIVADLATPHHVQVQVTVQSVTLAGSDVSAIMHWRYTAQHPEYTYIRNYTEQVLWVKRPDGWREISAHFLSDDLHYEKKPATGLT